MDVASALTAYNGLKAVKDFVVSLKDIKVETEVTEKINAAAKYIGEAQDTLFELRENLEIFQNENKALREKLESREDWNNRIKDYQLTTTKGGATVYKYLGDPEYFICTNCVEDNSIRILQEGTNAAGTHVCPKCKAEFCIVDITF